MEAGKRLIGDIFNKARHLEIPFFQRSYVWTEENWVRFMEDMQATATSRRPYFLGSVIQKQRATSSDTPLGDVRVIVDGQQRLTTLLLFFRTHCDVTGNSKLFEETFRTYSKSLTLKHNQADVEIFEAILEQRLTPDLRARHAASLVLQAHDHFEKHRETLATFDPIALLQLVYFVGIDLGVDEDEQQIFDTINSLGVDLTTAELLKNELFGREDIALYEATWKRVFEGDQAVRQYWDRTVTAGRSHRKMVDLFLQSYLSMQDDRKGDVRVERLFDGFKKYLKEPAQDRALVAHDLTECAALFAQNVRPQVEHEELVAGNALDRLCVVLFGLSTTTVFPYVLYVLRNVANPAERSRIFTLVENYLLRRLICRETTKNYNNIFTGLIKSGMDTRDKLAERLLNSDEAGVRFPTDEQVRRGFREAKLSNAQSKVVLYMIERSVRNDQRQSTALSGISHYSLEHLMPKKWRNNWGSVSNERAAERDEALHKLGNLSLLSSTLNTSIRDADWQTKKAGTGRQHGLDRYATGLETLVEDLALASWDVEEIGRRGERLAGQALDIWPFPELPTGATSK